MAKFTAGTYGETLGWRVGIHQWLDSDQSHVARYWRVQEFGDSSLVGVRLVGLWKGSPAPFTPGTGSQDLQIFGRSDSSPNLVGAARAALFQYLGGNPQAPQLVARTGGDIKKARAYYFWLMTRAPVDMFPFVQGVVTKPTKGHEYYQNALMGFDPAREELNAVRAVFNQVFGGATVGSKSVATKRLRAAAGSTRTGPAKGYTKNVGQYYDKISPGEITITASAGLQEATRDMQGRFSELASKVRDVNRMTAHRFQEAVVAQMQRDRARTPYTGALVIATADPRNRYPQ